MASKANLLKQGAKKTGKGLFSGMSPLNVPETEESAATEPVESKKEEKVTEPVKKNNVPTEAKEVTKKEPDKEIKVEDMLPSENKKNAEPKPVIENIVHEEPKAQEVAKEEISIKTEETEVVKPKINIQETTESILAAVKEEAPKKQEKSEKTSRYEKDKFLLLDIRGYRDYVEHMAKAANMSATKYIRNLIEQDQEKNKDIYEAHKKLEEMLKGRNGQ